MTKATQSPLVTAEWLAERLNTPDLVILDATFFLPNQGRNAREEYLRTHIPGALFFDIDAVADHATDLPHMLPSEAAFASAAGQLGIEEFSTVVVYDNNGFMASARAWWTFRAFGHAHVQVLDGGLAYWQSLGLPIRSGPETARPRSCPATLHPALVRNLGQMLDLIGHPEIQILDARPPGRFSGEDPEPRPGLRSGHIPGSHNLFYKRLIDEATHRFKTPGELAEAFASAGVNPALPLVATCGSGVTAAILALGLYLLGNEYAAVYDGSWAEWGQRQDTPIATEPEANAHANPGIFMKEEVLR